MAENPEKFESRMRHLIGGMTGGAVASLLLHPLDLIKIRMQVGILRENRQNVKIISHIKNIYVNRGLKGFFQGLAPNVIGNCTAWGLYLEIYDRTNRFFKKKLIHEDMRHKQTKKLDYIVPLLNYSSAIVSGFICLPPTNFMWVLKVRMATAPVGCQKYSSLIKSLKTLCNEEGLRGFFKGLAAGCIGVFHGAIFMVFYDRMKEMYKKLNENDSFSSMKTYEYLASSAISKSMATAITYPYQYIRSQCQKDSTVPTSLKFIIQSTYKNNGLIGFYQGFVPCIIRVLPSTCITFIIYESVVEYLK